MMLFRNFRRNYWRDQILACGAEQKQWLSVRGDIAPATDPVVEDEIDRLERRLVTLRNKIKETADV